MGRYSIYVTSSGRWVRSPPLHQWLDTNKNTRGQKGADSADDPVLCFLSAARVTTGFPSLFNFKRHVPDGRFGIIAGYAELSEIDRNCAFVVINWHWNLRDSFVGSTSGIRSKIHKDATKPRFSWHTRNEPECGSK
jgi:hypothetical protein